MVATKITVVSDEHQNRLNGGGRKEGMNDRRKKRRKKEGKEKQKKGVKRSLLLQRSIT